MLSSQGRFIPFHFCCAYNMMEVARDRLLVWIPASYSELEVPKGFLFEQEPLFSYCARVLINDEHSGLWVVAYTERVVRICSALLMAAYSQYRLWYVSPTVIRFARELGMGMAVPPRSAANVRELLEMLDINESTRFESLPDSWSERVSRSVDYHPGRSGPGVISYIMTPLSVER